MSTEKETFDQLDYALATAKSMARQYRRAHWVSTARFTNDGPYEIFVNGWADHPNRWEVLPSGKIYAWEDGVKVTPEYKLWTSLDEAIRHGRIEARNTGKVAYIAPSAGSPGWVLRYTPAVDRSHHWFEIRPDGSMDEHTHGRVIGHFPPKEFQIADYEDGAVVQHLGGDGKWRDVQTFIGPDRNAKALGCARDRVKLTGEPYRVQQVTTLEVFTP